MAVGDDAISPQPSTPKTASSRPRAVGIDLGTTLSAVAYISDSGQSTMIRNADGEILTPSVVLFEATDVVVGKKARLDWNTPGSGGGIRKA